jgi:hypothetical protein
MQVRQIVRVGEDSARESDARQSGRHTALGDLHARKGFQAREEEGLMARKRKPTNGGLRKGSPLVAARVTAIYEMMRVGDWERGKTGPLCAQEWGVSLAVVEKWAAEAWRRCCHEADNPEAMRPEIAGILRENLHRADSRANFRAIATLADVYTKIIGARAPERHEHAVVIAQFDSLNRDGKLEWIDKRIAKLQEARAALAEVSED